MFFWHDYKTLILLKKLYKYEYLILLMGKGLVIGIIIAIIVILVLVFSLGNFGSQETTTTDTDNVGDTGDGTVLDGDDGGDTGDDDSDGDDAGAPQSYTVEISSAGFSPSSLTINAGDIVVFVAVDGSNRWPASAFHPTHTAYPEGGGCIGSAFDACQEIANGDSYPFVFNEVGSWGYHDHLSPGKTGTIIVE